ncbi:amidohydrolase [Caldicellulosiruptoraceae bacterium PP1]
MKLLLKNPVIIGYDENFKDFYRSDILIVNDKIEKVYPNIEIHDADIVIDAEKYIAIPGLVNAHTHCGQTVLRSYADDLPFNEWLFDRVFPLESKLNQQIVYYSSLLGIAEMIKSGTTLFFDMYFYEDMTAKAVSETGIRAVLSRGLQTDENEHKRIEETLKLIQDYSSDRIKIFFGPHSIYTCSTELLENVSKLAFDYNTGIMIHVSESENEVNECFERHDCSPVKYLSDLGIFDSPTVAAHCVYVDNDDIDILNRKCVTVAYNPTSNLKLGNGFAPIYSMIQSGINVAIGTDSAASNNNLNMIEEMHIASLLEKGLYKLPNIMNASQILKMATFNGAYASLFENIGLIKEGYKADIVLIDNESLNMMPNFNPISNIVYSANPENIKTVICNGKILYKDGKLTTIDEEGLKKEIKDIMKYLNE